MALIKFSGLLSGISGKIGGTVFARNRSSAYARNWAKPTTAPTTKQTVNRARFGNQSSAWGMLDSAQRIAYNAAASAITLLNRLGEEYVPTGRQMFLASANNLANAGQATLSDPPANFEPPPIDDAIVITGSVDAGALDTLSLAYAELPNASMYIVEAAPVGNNVKQNMVNLYRQIATFATGAGDHNLLTEYTAVFGATAAVGQTIKFRIKTLNVENGMTSSGLIVETVLT
jgi:hypothetical protein